MHLSHLMSRLCCLHSDTLADQAELCKQPVMVPMSNSEVEKLLWAARIWKLPCAGTLAQLHPG